VKVRFAIAILLLSVQLIGCEHKSDAQRKYEELLHLDNVEIRKEFRSLSPSQQVELYLYGAVSIRPADFSFAPYLDGKDVSTVGLLADRLRLSGSKKETFALVYALHGVTGNDLARAGVMDLRAREACDQFFTAPSPCHQLAIDIDALTDKGP